MNILAGARLSGLARALDGAVQDGRHQVTIVSAVADVAWRLNDARPLDVLILDDRLDPDGDEPIPDSLWRLIYLAGTRRPPTRPLLILREDVFPLDIRDALIGAAQERRGSAYLAPRWSTPADDAQAVQWVLTQVQLETRPAQHWIMPLSAAGGCGKTTQLGNLALALQRRGLRTLLIDADFANGSLTKWLKAPPGSFEPFVTLPQDEPNPGPSYSLDAVRRRIAPHPSGIDLLSSGSGLSEVADMAMPAMLALVAAVRQLPYDVVCLDTGPDLKARPYALHVLRDGSVGMVVAQPGRKEREGAAEMLRILRDLAAPDRNASLLAAAALLGVEAERGSIADIYQVHADLLRLYPVVDLGVVPRDPRLISTVAESTTFLSVYDVAPRSAYCRAMEQAVDRLLAWRRVPTAAGAAAGEARPWWRRLLGAGASVTPQEALP